MRQSDKWGVALAFTAALVFGSSNGASAAGKIVCWKDKSGRMVGCGDTVPPEYRDNATKELDKRGVTRKTTVSADEEARRKAREAELADQKAEQERKAAEQKRQDAALLSTYYSVKEIDDQRNRELQQADQRIGDLQASLKKARSDAEKKRIQERLATANRDKAAVNEKYAGYRKRFIELRGTGGATAPTTGPKSAK